MNVPRVVLRLVLRFVSRGTLTQRRTDTQRVTDTQRGTTVPRCNSTTRWWHRFVQRTYTCQRVPIVPRA
jgi:hypothetical protein